MGYGEYAAALVAGLGAGGLSFGKMREPVQILRIHYEKDADGFAAPSDEILARVRA